MCIPLFRNNSKIILIYLYDFSYQIPEDKVHLSLKSGSNIHKAKMNSQIYVSSPWVVKEVLNWSSFCTKTWLYPKNPSNIDIVPTLLTLCSKCSMFGRGQLSLRDSWLRFIKSTHNQISPLFFWTTTKLSIQEEYLMGSMIFASTIFW